MLILHSAGLWMFLDYHAVYIHNHLPNRKNGLAPPLEIFSGTKWPTHKYNDLQVWRSPVYILDSTAQDGRKLPGWKPCLHHSAVFLGLSEKHA